MTPHVELASQDETLEHEVELCFILDVLGHPGALVSDESTVRDFLDWTDEPSTWWRASAPHIVHELPADPTARDRNVRTMCKLEAACGFRIEEEYRLVDIAKRLREKRRRFAEALERGKRRL
jgi:hypothetical protein